MACEDAEKLRSESAFSSSIPAIIKNPALRDFCVNVGSNLKISTHKLLEKEKCWRLGGQLTVRSLRIPHVVVAELLADHDNSRTQTRSQADSKERYHKP